MRERTQRSFPSSNGVLYTHNAQGGEWGGDIWEKEGDSSRQGDFYPIHSPQEDTSERDRRVLSTKSGPQLEAAVWEESSRSFTKSLIF